MAIVFLVHRPNKPKIPFPRSVLCDNYRLLIRCLLITMRNKRDLYHYRGKNRRKNALPAIL